MLTNFEIDKRLSLVCNVLGDASILNMSYEDIKRRCFSDLPLYSLLFFPHHIEPRYGIPDFHREIYSYYLDRTKRRIAIAAPRGHSKSTITNVIFLSHQILFRQIRYAVVISKTGEKAKEEIETIADEFSENEMIRTFFGDITCDLQDDEEGETFVKGKTRSSQKMIRLYLGKDKNNADYYVTVKARGYTQQGRGLKVGRFRPDLIIADDVDDEDTVNTPELRIKWRRRFLRATVPSIDKDRGRIIVIGNYVHDDCLIKNLIDATLNKGYDVWNVLFFKCGYGVGKPIWEKRWTMKDLHQAKKEFDIAGDPYGFLQEYENETVSIANRQFKQRNLFKGYVVSDNISYLVITEKNGIKLNTPEYKLVNIFAACDPAIGQSKYADYFAFSIIAVDYENNIYIIEYIIEHGIKQDQIISIYTNAARKYGKSLKYIGTEDNNFQVLIIGDVMKEFTKQNIGIRLIPIKNIKNKILRISSLQHYNEDNKFWVQSEMFDLIEEMDGFPFGKHEHILDSIEMAVRFKSRPSCSSPEELSTKKRLSIRKRDDERRDYNWLYH